MKAGMTTRGVTLERKKTSLSSIAFNVFHTKQF